MLEHCACACALSAAFRISAEDIVSGNMAAVKPRSSLSQKQARGQWLPVRSYLIYLRNLFSHTDPESSPHRKKCRFMRGSTRGTLTKSLNGRMRVTGWAGRTSPTTTTPAWVWTKSPIMTGWCMSRKPSRRQQRCRQ